MVWTPTSVTTVLDVRNFGLPTRLYTYLKFWSKLITWMGTVVSANSSVMGWTALDGSLLDTKDTSLVRWTHQLTKEAVLSLPSPSSRLDTLSVTVSTLILR